MKELLVGYLVTTLNLTAEEIGKILFKKDPKTGEETLNDNVNDVLLEADKTRVKDIKAGVKIDPAKEKELRDEGHGRGLKEGLTNLEKEIKTEFGLETDLQGIELIQEVVKTKSKTPPDVEELQRKFNTKEAELETKQKGVVTGLQDKIKELETGQAKSEVLTVVRDRAKEKLSGLKLITSGIPANIMSGFMSDISKANYIIENGKVLMKNDKGEILRDDHEKEITFEDHVKTTAEAWFTTEGDGKDGTGNKNADDTGGSSDFSKMTEKEKIEAYGKATPEERKAMAEDLKPN